MIVWSYCATDWQQTTQAVSGTKPHISPPHNHESITAGLKEASLADIVYLNLHGFSDQPHYYGQLNGTVGPTALTVENVKRYDWSNTVVFAEVCFSASENRPIATAFLDNGATAFVGSTSTAYGRVRPTFFDGEADRLAHFFIRTYDKLGDPVKALLAAKRWLRAMSLRLDDDDRATLKSFVVITRNNKDGRKTEGKL